MEFYISTKGNDGWSGRFVEPKSDTADGPFATIDGARRTLRELRQAGKLAGPVTVYLRGGRYPVANCIRFEPEDSWPTTYEAYQAEEVILDGGVRIEGWRVETRGDTAFWVVDLPEVAAGKWYFRQLFVNGSRRTRPRLPKEGFYWIEDVPGFEPTAMDEGKFPNTFRCAPGDIQAWENLTDIDVVALHYWLDERMPIASFDPNTRLVTSSRRSVFGDLSVGGRAGSHEYARYHVENVKEALSEPGEWYLDRPTGRLCYIPMPGEGPENAAVYAPRTDQLLKLAGRPDNGEHVEHLRFAGLRFQHTQWRQPPGGGERWGYPAGDYANSPQAAGHLPGAISMEGARYCAVEDCTIEHVGWYGIELVCGCLGNRIVGNTLTDIGAGGIKLEGSGVPQTVAPARRRTGNNQITDNHIVAGGRVFPSAVGILCTDSFGNDISHNHIHDLYYSGISCGWVWGYLDNGAKDNRIEKNHVYDIGQGMLCDLGGIYTLGVQPGTVIRGNLVHDVEHSNPGHGGRGIYLDQGSSHIVVEDNIVYNMSSSPLYLNYGRENVVRNNIFAFGREGQAGLSSVTPPELRNAFTFERNIVLTDTGPVFYGRNRWTVETPVITSDLNVFWNVSGNAPVSGNTRHFDPPPPYTIEKWREFGYDHHSIVADPRCHDLASFDFTLEEDSPAWPLGFRPIDMSDVGPRTGLFKGVSGI